MEREARKYTANIEDLLVVDEPDKLAWHDRANLVVIGFGGAGVVASLQALEQGGSVIAVDRFSGGGATEKSGGVVYAGGTRHQRDAGFDDTVEEMFKYLSYEGVPVRDETLRRFCETSNENIEWLEGFGVRFGSSYFEERISYPPEGYFLYYSGMEKFRGDRAKIVPRGHRTLGRGPTGQNYFAPLKDAALRKGVRLITHAPARRLVVDSVGRVIGVEIQVIPEAHRARHESLYQKVDPYKLGSGRVAEKAIADCRAFEESVPTERRLLRADRGVVLAAGGYNYNLELFAKYRPIIKDVYGDITRGGSMGCDGSGIELGISAGGALSHMDRFFVTKPLSPPPSFVQGVLVNAEGQRYIAEDAYLGNIGCATSEQSGLGTAWLILDNRIFWKGFRELIWPLKNAFSWYGLPAILNIFLGGTKRARSIVELASRCGIEESGLERTLSEFNVCAKQRLDTEHGKMAIHLTALENPPYFALNMSLRNKWCFSGAMPFGGLTVEEDTGVVTRADGSLVEGLYAAGRTALGVCSESNFSGLSIADTIFSGRRAASAALSSGVVQAVPEAI
ncbi:MAG: FAD-binding protein [Halieaceae bacterium]|nr:FAD-binding protein [Halieaceae bacterium]